MGKQTLKNRYRLPLHGGIALVGGLLLCAPGAVRAQNTAAPAPITEAGTGTASTATGASARTQPVQPLLDPDSVLAELIKQGATMEEIAKLRDPVANNPVDALRALKTGNARFYGGVARRPEMSANERRAQILSQTPFAVVLGCSDSRVPTELVYDQGLGSIFSIRVAGNVIEPGTLGSIEYAVEHLKSHIVIVMGHEGCGAVSAAMLPAAQRNAEPANVRFLLDRILPAVSNLPAIRDNKAKMREAVISNVRVQVHQLRQNPVIDRAIKNGKITVAGAYYEIGSGAVDFLETPEELRLSPADLRAITQQARVSARTTPHQHVAGERHAITDHHTTTKRHAADHHALVAQTPVPQK
ncbi:MAG: carbonic anhydrase [Abditibacteriota bacterium]|nr:carbonic anhydrase [Abditibacteriota bacterium]